MFRYLILVMLVALGALNAQAWQTLDGDEFKNLVQKGRCESRTDFKRCAASWPTFVRTENGSTKVQYMLARNDVTEADIEGLLKEMNISTQRYLDFARKQRGGNAGSLGLDYFAKNMVLQGLLASDGKTELLPSIYKTVYPVSDTLVMVRKINNAWGFVTPGDPASFRDIGFGWDTFDFLFGQLETKPTMLVFKGKSDAPGLEKYTVIDAKGQPTLTIDRVKPRDGQGRSYAFFDGGYLGFPVRTEEGTDISVFVKSATLDVDRIGPPFEILRYGWRIQGNYNLDVGRTGFKDVAMEKVGSFSSSHGILAGDIYLPLDEWNGYAKINHEADGEKIIGMVPLYLPKPYQHVRGWITVHGDDTRRWYKLVAHAPEEDAGGKLQIGKKRELEPQDIVGYAKYFPPVADIWIGTADEALYKARFEDADPRDIPQPGLRVVVRLFDDPSNPETSGITDWVSTGDDIHRRAVEKVYDADISTLKTHPFDPQALITNDVIVHAGVEYAMNRDDREYREMTPAQRKAREARREANYQALLADVQLASADEVMQPGRSVREYANFYKVAKTHGGKYLKAYWREYRHLPDIEDSGEICRRFGQNSEECRLVWPTAQAYYAEEKAKADRAAERYAREEMDRRFDPNWNRPSKSKEPRCYNNYDGTQTCFSD
ncbi:hypothetical protein [Hyphomonas pacifica]|uniref:hypothetical protein n=1 Tax=Hyphomonas pacifica TaxID=1280941 RepID=UPI0011BE88A8|nr:hypothetical protein [Hyphomonas pacifica]